MQSSCLCGAVRFEIKDIAPDIANCHCSMCRKSSGSAFGVYGTVPENAITWHSGQQTIREYQSSAKAKRGFCPTCGSNIYYRQLGENQPYEIALGCLDTEPNQAVNANIYYASKPAWSTDFEGLPSFAEERNAP